MFGSKRYTAGKPEPRHRGVVEKNCWHIGSLWIEFSIWTHAKRLRMKDLRREHRWNKKQMHITNWGTKSRLQNQDLNCKNQIEFMYPTSWHLSYVDCVCFGWNGFPQTNWKLICAWEPFLLSMYDTYMFYADRYWVRCPIAHWSHMPPDTSFMPYWPHLHLVQQKSKSWFVST